MSSPEVYRKCCKTILFAMAETSNKELVNYQELSGCCRVSHASPRQPLGKDFYEKICFRPFPSLLPF